MSEERSIPEERSMPKEFTGMMITLKKRMMCVTKDDTEKFEYLMFGHYDGMDISCTDQWYKLRPKGVEEINGNVAVQDTFWDKYTVKAYFPSKETREGLEKEGFAYALWDRLGRRRNDSGKKEKLCEETLQKFPFISVAMINLSKECVEKETDLLEKLGQIIQEAASEKLENIHCAIMPSIGYADFVLLFLSNELGNVFKTLDHLRKASVEKDGNQYAMLSNSYAISGFAREGLDALKKKEIHSGAKLSIRVNLRDGVAASQFRKFFDEKLGELLAGHEEFEGNKVHDLYQVFGNADCLVLSDMSLDFFVPLFYDNQLLNPGHKLFQTYIQHTRCSIRVEIDGEDDTTDIKNSGKEALEKYREEFEDLVKQLKDIAEEYNIPRRTINGVQGVMKLFLNLVQFSHCFDIEKTIGAAFETMHYNVGRTVEIIAAETEEKNKEEYAEQLFAAIGEFREKIGDYLADMQRSERFFIEGQSLSHPSIGSATKLLFFYNTYISDMAKRLLKTEEEKRECKYTFVVTSGGCDVTTAIDLFSYINPAEEKNHSLIIISIPEMSLYDVRGTMFRLLHECLHFCGERQRETRRQKIIEGFSISSAAAICKGLAQSMKEHLNKKIIENFRGRMTEAMLAEIKEAGEKIIEEESRELCRELQEKLEEELKKETNEPEASDKILLYSRAVYNDIFWVFKGNIISEESFFRSVYKMFVTCQQAAAAKLKEYLAEKGIPFSGADIWQETAAAKARLAEEGNGYKIDSQEISLLETILRNYVDTTVFGKEMVEIADNDLVTAEDVMDNLQAVLKECFADCIAAKILQLPLEDFILCFVYETWNLSRAFPDNDMGTLRTVLELKILYGISGKLTEENRGKIEDKIQYWEDRGFTYGKKGEDYAGKLCDRIDLLLGKNSGEVQYVGFGPVEEYLKECIELYEKKDFADAVKISRLSDMSSAEDMSKLLKRVRLSWRDTTKEETV